MADPIITIAQRLKPTFARIGGISEADADAVVRRSDRADAQVNGSLALAKQLGKSPREIAQLVLDEADLSSVCSSVEIAGPGFINITFAPEFLAAELARAAADPRLGVSSATVAQTVVIDYSAPNVAKEMHVGQIGRAHV